MGVIHDLFNDMQQLFSNYSSTPGYARPIGRFETIRVCGVAVRGGSNDGSSNRAVCWFRGRIRSHSHEGPRRGSVTPSQTCPVRLAGVDRDADHVRFGRHKRDPSTRIDLDPFDGLSSPEANVVVIGPEHRRLERDAIE